jgi:hypothetical protein
LESHPENNFNAYYNLSTKKYCGSQPLTIKLNREQCLFSVKFLLLHLAFGILFKQQSIKLPQGREGECGSIEENRSWVDFWPKSFWTL